MSELPQISTAGTGLWRAVLTALFAGAAGFLAIYVQLPAARNEAPAPAVASDPAIGTLTNLNRGEMAAFVIKAEPQLVPEVAFKDAGGKDLKLADFRGKVIALNLWATWCTPCRKEMPALDRLKTAFAGRLFDVVALNSERGGLEKVAKFFAETKIAALAVYSDVTGKTLPVIGGLGLPMTILIDRQGREIGRLTGAAEWDSADAKKLIEAAIGAP